MSHLDGTAPLTDKQSKQTSMHLICTKHSGAGSRMSWDPSRHACRWFDRISSVPAESEVAAVLDKLLLYQALGQHLESLHAASSDGEHRRPSIRCGEAGPDPDHGPSAAQKRCRHLRQPEDAVQACFGMQEVGALMMWAQARALLRRLMWQSTVHCPVARVELLLLNLRGLARRWRAMLLELAVSVTVVCNSAADSRSCWSSTTGISALGRRIFQVSLQAPHIGVTAWSPRQ
jgi:hypothetical protein